MLARKFSFWNQVDQFFFALEVPYGLAICRIVFPIVLMGMVGPRWYVVRELYSTDGATAQLSIGYGCGSLLPEFGATIAVALYSILVFSLISSSIGWCTRTSLTLSAVLFTYFSLLDYVSTMTKYSVIATHVLSILAMSHCGSLWSVDAWLKGQKRNYWPGEPAVEYERFPAWPRRLLQIFVAVLYFGAAITKVHTPIFFQGDMLQFWMQTHINFGHPIGEFVSLFPILLIAFAYITFVWEFSFIFLCWNRTGRMFTLTLGVFFHFMTTLTLGLLMFPMICYCAYLSFVNEDDVRQAAAGFRRLCRKTAWIKSAVTALKNLQGRLPNPIGWQMASGAAMIFSMAIFAVATVEIEYWQDLYGERRPEGPYPLVVMDEKTVDKMLAPSEPLRLIDRFISLDLGSLLVGDRLAFCRNSFRQGETMIAHCNLNPPHEDMFIEAKFLNAENVVVDNYGTIASRDIFRMNFTFPLTDATPPGEYTVQIFTAGQHVMSKTFRVLPRHGTVSAN